jgi:hypothetical protein
MAKKKPSVQFNKTPEEVVRERQRNLQEQRDAQQRDAQARMAQIKQPRQPHGGAPEVEIPPLNASPIEGGGTMQDQAQALRDPTSPLSPAYNPQMAQMMSNPQAPPMVPRMAPGGRVSDPAGGPFAPLPPEAAKQPGFRGGVGSMIQGNQPGIDPKGYKPQISPETHQSMQALAAFQEGARQQQEKPPETETSTKLKEAMDKEEDLYKELRDVLDDPAQWNLLNNPKRKKEIEARLEPMDITDVIIHGEIRQMVPVVPGKLEPEYRSVSAEEDLSVKQMMFGEAGSDRYLMDKYTIMQLTLGLVALNGEELPSHLDDKKKFNEDKFLKKFDKVVRFPLQLIADLGVQYLWFDERVRALFLGGTEELKNT